MASRLLLIEDVEDLGRSGEIVSVKPGYARNFLLPQGLAVIANARAIRLQTRLQEEREKKAAIDRQESEKLSQQLQGVTLTVHVKVDHEGHMYGSVTVADIVHLIQEQHKVTLEKKAVQLKHPIKEVGAFDIPLKLKEGVVASFHLKVLPEGAEDLTEKSAQS